MEIHQSFGNINAITAAINNNPSLCSPTNGQANESGLSAGFKAFIEKEVVKKTDKELSKGKQSNTAKRSRKDLQDDDNYSENINVSE